MAVARFIRGAAGASDDAVALDVTVDASLLAAVKFALRIDPMTDAADQAELDAALARNITAGLERANRQAPGAPQATVHEGVIRFSGWLYEGAQVPGQDPAAIWRLCGAEALLAPWTIRRAGAIGA